MNAYMERKERVQKLNEEEKLASAKAATTTEPNGDTGASMPILMGSNNNGADVNQADGEGIVDLISGLKRTSTSASSPSTSTVMRAQFNSTESDEPTNDSFSFRSPYTNQLHEKMRRTTFYI